MWFSNDLDIRYSFKEQIFFYLFISIVITLSFRGKKCERDRQNLAHYSAKHRFNFDEICRFFSSDLDFSNLYNHPIKEFLLDREFLFQKLKGREGADVLIEEILKFIV
uniref:Uncharacterized protein n=1 Tax=Ascaris lumbricoides TaxID=6252 RepID=A0A9J2PL61_ASCLU